MRRVGGSLYEERTVTIELGTFARCSIETRLGSNLRLGVLAAIQHYIRRLQSGWQPVLPPSFACGPLPGDGATTLELQIGPVTLATLERQAEIHRVPLNRVLVHAVFVYLADLESKTVGGFAKRPILH